MHYFKTYLIISSFPGLPASLKLQKIQNMIIIDPTPNTLGVFYNVTSDDNIIRRGILNGSAILIQESKDVSFFCMEASYNFNIGNFFNIFNQML